MIRFTDMLSICGLKNILSLCNNFFAPARVIDNPDQLIPQKMIHGQINHNFKALKKEEKTFHPLPKGNVKDSTIKENFLRIKREVKTPVGDEIDKILNTPDSRDTIIKN